MNYVVDIEKGIKSLPLLYSVPKCYFTSLKRVYGSLTLPHQNSHPAFFGVLPEYLNSSWFHLHLEMERILKQCL
jgi:hypothetical protein